MFTEKTEGHSENIDKKIQGMDIKEELGGLKKSLEIPQDSPIYAYLEKFDKYFQAKKKLLLKGEILFSEGKNDYFYVLISGGLDIFRNTADGRKKEIGKVKPGYFIGEGVIFGRDQKDVEVVASENSEMYALSGVDLKLFEKENSELSLDLYKYIIEVTNKRLLNTGKELATIYDATNKLREMSRLGEKWFPKVMDYVKDLVGADYIVYVENHQAIDGLFFYKYSTLEDEEINKRAGEEINKDLNGIQKKGSKIYGTQKKDSIYVFPLKHNDLLKGFFIIGKKKDEITDYEMRISVNIGQLLGAIIDFNQQEAEERAKKMKKNLFDNSLNSV